MNCAEPLADGDAGTTAADTVRILLVEDSVLLREGLARLFATTEEVTDQPILQALTA